MENKYQIQPDLFWQATLMYGDGYNVAAFAEQEGWEVVNGWGAPGHVIGNWPYVIIFIREVGDLPTKYQLVQYVEGDIEQYSFPTEELRTDAIDNIAFSYWKHRKEAWVEGIETVEQLPAKLRGPYKD